MRGFLPKNEPIRPRRLGCRGRGAAIDLSASHLIFRSFLYKSLGNYVMFNPDPVNVIIIIIIIVIIIVNHVMSVKS